MERKKEDRRIRITKQAIQESLIELMQCHPISKISVKMLCETADINRSTFYTHYKDQYDLLCAVQEDILAQIKGQVFAAQFFGAPESAVLMLVQILGYAKANAPLLKALLGEHGKPSFHMELMQIAQEKLMEEFSGELSLSSREMQYLKRFALSGILSIMQHWLEEECADDPHMLAELMLKLVMHGSNGLRAK